eukprot:SAG25_NODE_11779_length_295_cov_1.030612_1_plen_72_part_10
MATKWALDRESHEIAALRSTSFSQRVLNAGTEHTEKKKRAPFWIPSRFGDRIDRTIRGEKRAGGGSPGGRLA